MICPKCKANLGDIDDSIKACPNCKTSLEKQVEPDQVYGETGI